MKSIRSCDLKRKLKFQSRFWLPIAIALPLTGIALAVNPSEMRSWIGSLGQAQLEAPYRYRFARTSLDSATGSAAVEQEIAFYQKRVARNPTDGLDLASLASAYLKMARLTGISSWYLLAEQSARRSLTNLPFNNPGAALALARIAEAKHDFAGAIRLADGVLRSQPNHEEALAQKVTANLAMGNVKEASQIAEALVNRIPTTGTLTLQALVKTTQGKDRDAIQDFRQALAAEEAGDAPSSAHTRTLLGRLYFQRGDSRKAAQLYREALRILPHYPLALVHLAQLETRLGNYSAAERHYSEVLATSQDSTARVFDRIVLRGRAQLRELQGDRSGARELQNQAEAQLRQDLDRSNFGHRRELAHLLLERDLPGDAAEALSLMQAEVRLRKDPETLGTFAWALLRLDRGREAQQAMGEALRWGTRDAALFYRAAAIERKLGNVDRANTFFQAALQTDPTFDDRARRIAGLGLESAPNAQL
ncbi:tetratricopeptide repeat protein [Altericista sp. CCNU0014]|uniref:tetratricopeptide repeat protein n=1 Tax=Altericista sp. CCNU0014 TaxID=3082949 RepID=UPI00384A8D24